MKIHEYQAKELFRKAQVPVLAGIVAKTPAEAKAAFEKLGGPIAVVKAQVHAGGRGKGTVTEVPSQRGVQLVKSGRRSCYRGQEFDRKPSGYHPKLEPQEPKSIKSLLSKAAKSLANFTLLLSLTGRLSYRC